MQTRSTTGSSARSGKAVQKAALVLHGRRDTVADAVHSGEIAPVNPQAATAAIVGIVLQTALFHIYGSLSGPLAARAAGLTRAALAAITALGGAEP